MLSTNRILLFIATVILCGLLFGLELGFILLITAAVCFNSYEPFSNDTELESPHQGLDDGFELEDSKVCSEESDSPVDANEQGSKPSKRKGKSKMSLWRPRKTGGATVKLGKADSSTPNKLSGLSSPSARPPLRFTGSPFGKSVLCRDKNVNEDQENSSLWGNPYSPSTRRKPQDCTNQSNVSAGPLLSSPFLPRVKRAIGVGEAALLQKQSNSPRRSSYGVSGNKVFSPQPKALPYPSSSSAGWVPLVRLGRPDKPVLNENNSNMVHSPGTVKIAAPSPRRLNYSSRLSVSREESEEVVRRAPDTETVLSALREKSRKRGIATHDESMSEVTDQQSKRRKQDDSTSSSSSMVSEPEFLAELPVNGYSNIPLHMVGMKRPATPTVDIEQSLSLERIVKKSKTDNRNNSIVSSLSSSRRGMAKEMKEFQRGEKRKPEDTSQIAETQPSNKQTKTDGHLPPCSVSSTATLEGRPKPKLADTVVSRSVMDTPTQTVPPAGEETKPPISLKKKLLFDAERASQKVKQGIYIGLTSPRSKMAALDVTTDPEDYDRDPEAERQRAIDMLIGTEANSNGTLKNGFDKSSAPLTTTTVQSTVTSSSTTSQLPTTTTPPVTTAAPSTLTDLLKASDGQTVTNTVSSSGGLLSSVLFSSETTTTTTVSTGVSATATATSASDTTTTTSASQNGTAVSEPQFTFKPVFPTTPASSTVTSGQGQATGGFSFSSAASTSTQASESVSSSTAVTSAAATVTAPSNTPAFSFGGITQTSAASAGVGASLGPSQAPQLNFSAKTPSVVSSSSSTPQTNTSTFGFGAASQPATAALANSTAASSSGFTFGSAVNPAKPAAAAAPFSFGQSSTSTPTTSSSAGFGLFQSPSLSAPAPAPNSGIFGFGSGSTQQTTATVSSGLSTAGFGTPTTTATTGNSQVTSVFGAAATAKTASNSQMSSGFAFGQPQQSTVSSAQSAGKNSTGGGFSFSTTSATTQSATQPAASVFSFGGAAPSNPALTTTSGLAFGSSQVAPQSSSAGGFNFSSSASATPSFNQPIAAPFAQSAPKAGLFGTATTTSQAAPTSVFGAQPSNSATTNSVFGSSGSGFSFGQSSAPVFGQTTTTTAAAPSSVFGATATTTAASSGFQFGATSTTTPAAFGSTGSAFAFGGGTNNSSVTGSAFGAKQSSSLPVPTFGTPQTTQTTSVFGSKPAAFSQSSGSAFGSFGSQQPSSVFGGTQTQQPSGAAPGFGQSTTSAFGASNPGGQGSFSFGQTANPATTTPVKAFDFSAAASGTPSLQFGSASNQMSGFTTPNQKTPVMNFGSGTPAGSTPAFGNGSFGAPAGGMFSVGSGATAPRPRSRARRKGTKR